MMTTIKFGATTLCLAVALTLASRVEASTIALQSFSGGFLATSATNQLYGWEFDALTSISVNALGVFDENNDGLDVAHDVGIFRVTGQSLLTSTTLAAGTGATLLNGFRYRALGSPLLLIPDRYVIVMTMPQSNGDRQWIINSTVGTAAQIAYITSTFDQSSTLAFPSPAFNGAFAQGLFGPNFQFDAAAAAVPEPTSLILLGSGLLGFAARRRARRQ